MKITLGNLTTLIMEETERLLSEMDISDADLDTLFDFARNAEPRRKKKAKTKVKSRLNPLSHLERDDLEDIIGAFLAADPSFADTSPDEFSDEEDDLFMGDDEDYMPEGK